jgi:hypothetical protein
LRLSKTLNGSSLITSNGQRCLNRECCQSEASMFWLLSSSNFEALSWVLPKKRSKLEYPNHYQQWKWTITDQESTHAVSFRHQDAQQNIRSANLKSETRKLIGIWNKWCKNEEAKEQRGNVMITKWNSLSSHSMHLNVDR